MDIKKIIVARMKEMDVTTYWLAQKCELPERSVYNFTTGGRKSTNLAALGKIMDALKLDIVAKR